ncbi:MAG: polyprenyl diphosphate synthase [Promethearchaeota archaeon]
MKIWDRILYYFYERRLKKQIKNGPMPHHLGIIMDGNRRYAQKFGRDANWGHLMGYNKVRELLNWCFDLGIKNLTLYTLSTENFNRSSDELEGLYELIRQGCEEVKQEPSIHKNKVHIKAIGRLHLLPDELQQENKELEEITKDNNNLKLTMAVAYGGRAEIIDAIKKIAQKVKEGIIDIEDIDEKTVQQHLYKPGFPDCDMIIRTSGEKRLSGFLLWQSAYSELYFEDAYFPEFRKIDFWRAIRAYQKRVRRFGI